MSKILNLWQNDRTGFWLVFTFVFNAVLFLVTYALGGRML